MNESELVDEIKRNKRVILAVYAVKIGEGNQDDKKPSRTNIDDFIGFWARKPELKNANAEKIKAAALAAYTGKGFEKRIQNFHGVARARIRRRSRSVRRVIAFPLYRQFVEDCRYIVGKIFELHELRDKNAQAVDKVHPEPIK